MEKQVEKQTYLSTWVFALVPAGAMALAGWIFTTRQLSSNTLRIFWWLAFTFVGAVGFAILSNRLRRYHQYIFAASSQAGGWYGQALSCISDLLTLGLAVASHLTGWFAGDGQGWRSQHQRYGLSWGLVLGITLGVWLALLGWLVYLNSSVDCVRDANGSPIPWSVYSAHALQPKILQGLLARGVGDRDRYRPEIVHVTYDAARNLDLTSRLDSSESLPPGENECLQSNDIKAGDWPAPSMGVHWSPPVGCAPPRPSREGVTM